MGGGGWAIMQGALEARVWGSKGRAGQAQLQVVQHPGTRLRLDLPILFENEIALARSRAHW